MEANEQPDLDWSAPKNVTTRRGERVLRTAPPDGHFWAMWRKNKEALRATGYSVSKHRTTGAWEVCRWTGADDAPPPPPPTAAQQAEAIDASAATDASADIPVPDGLALLPYQRAGASYCLERPDVLLADEMGLGKTIQAIGVINATNAKRVLVVCPASLRLNWQRELTKWLTAKLTVGVAMGKAWPTGSDVVIINYDILSKHAEALRAETWDVLVCDESHYLKSPKAARTAHVLGKISRDKAKRLEPIRARRRMFLTGTPIVNRPIELYPVLASIAPDDFGNWRRFARQYCAAKHTRWGWDVSGASNLDELQSRLRSTCMVRRLKADVLAELPPKRRQVIALTPNGASAAVAAEQQAWADQQAKVEAAQMDVELSKASDDPEDYRAAVAALREAAQFAFAEIAQARHAVAMAKIPSVVEHVQLALEQGPVVLFAHHRDVIAALREAFPIAVAITGATSMTDRDRAVQAFQSGDSDLLIGNIQAAGVGLTLTRSSHVIFAELDWVPGNLSQAEDRTHRIGQAASVLVQHIVLDGSLDQRMAELVISKQTVIDQALNNRVSADSLPLADAPPITPIATKDRAASERTSRDQITELASKMTDEIRANVREGLDYLAAACDGARAMDGQGVSKIDARIGKELAGRSSLTDRQAALGALLCRKYRRQLRPENVADLATWLKTAKKRKLS